MKNHVKSFLVFGVLLVSIFPSYHVQASNILTGTIIPRVTKSSTISIAGKIEEMLTFNLGSSFVLLNTFPINFPGAGSHKITALTNSSTGMVVAYTGNTLTSGTNSVTGLATASDGAINARQFGLNLVSNATPAIGGSCSGTNPIASIDPGYDITGKFKFNSGDTILRSPGPINTTICTVSYITNIIDTTPVGDYSTVLTFVASSTTI